MIQLSNINNVVKELTDMKKTKHTNKQAKRKKERKKKKKIFVTLYKGALLCFSRAHVQMCFLIAKCLIIFKK